MTSFEYLAALISMVAALGIARALSGIARIIHMKGKVTISLIHLTWTGSALLWLMAFWWFTFALGEVESWTYLLLLFTVIYAAAIYFLIALLYPDPIEDGTDLYSHFAEYRKWFFGTLIAIACIDIADSLVKEQVTEMGGPPLIPSVIFMSIWISIGITGLSSENQKVQGVIAALYLITVFTWVSNMLFVM